MSAPLVQPYLYFNGRCEEALAFYSQALGAEVIMRMRFNESPEPLPPGRLPPGFENKIMHASFRVGQSILMASDGCETESNFKGFALSYAVATAEEADRAFAALSEDGKIDMPLTPTFWSPKFGMTTDRFGVQWMVMVSV